MIRYDTRGTYVMQFKIHHIRPSVCNLYDKIMISYDTRVTYVIKVMIPGGHAYDPPCEIYMLKSIRKTICVVRQGDICHTIKSSHIRPSV